MSLSPQLWAEIDAGSVALAHEVVAEFAADCIKGFQANAREHAARAAAPAAPSDVDPTARLMRLLCELPTNDDAGWLWAAVAAYLDVQGFPFPTAVPNTPGRWRRLWRNVWLARAHRLGGEDGVALAEQWATFITRGPYRRWKDDETPPEHAGPFEAALFYASKFNGNEALCATQIADALGILARNFSRGT